MGRVNSYTYCGRIGIEGSELTVSMDLSDNQRFIFEVIKEHARIKDYPISVKEIVDQTSEMGNAYSRQSVSAVLNALMRKGYLKNGISRKNRTVILLRSI